MSDWTASTWRTAHGGPEVAPAPAIWFHAEGEPVPQGSKALMPRGGKRGGRGVLVENSNLATKNKPPNRLRDWRSLVAMAGAKARTKAGIELLNEPLVLHPCHEMAEEFSDRFGQRGTPGTMQELVANGVYGGRSDPDSDWCRNANSDLSARKKADD